MVEVQGVEDYRVARVRSTGWLGWRLVDLGVVVLEHVEGMVKVRGFGFRWWLDCESRGGGVEFLGAIQ